MNYTEIVKMKFGAHLYGTNTENSDQDYKGVFLPSANQILLQNIPKSISKTPIKSVNQKNTKDDVDWEIFSLNAYFKFLVEGQTMALDMLFAPNSAILTKTVEWDFITQHKHKLISKQTKSFVGYCRTQANKYGIRGSRIHSVREILGWFDDIISKYTNPTTKIFEPEVEQSLRNFLYTTPLPHVAIVYIPHPSQPQPIPHLECCGRKVPFFITLKAGREVYQKILVNYGQRALLAEQNQNIDWKALSHAVRVGVEAIELLETKNISFPLANAQHLVDIKCGRVTYNMVADEIEMLLEKIETLFEHSTLPEQADTNFIADFVKILYSKQVVQSQYHQKEYSWLNVL